MSFGNLQKMALQMQQDMQRVEEELAAAVLEGTAGGGVVRRRRDRQAGARARRRSTRARWTRRTSRCSRTWSWLRSTTPCGRPRELGEIEDGRRHRRPPPARDVGERQRVVRRHRARRPPHRGVLAAARDRSQDGPAPDLPPAPGAGRRGAVARGRPRRRSRRGRLLRPPASTSATRPPARSVATGRATAAGCAWSRSRSTSSRSSGRASSRGRYHVLHGAISPMDGIGPERLRIAELLERAADGPGWTASRSRRSSWPPTRSLEGEVTADVPRRSGSRAASGLVTRIARGLPVGGDLEYADEVTLIRALQGRRAV